MNNPFSSTSGLANQPTEQQSQNDGVAWWFKWLIKIIAVLFGLIGFILGIVVAISTTIKCIIAGVIFNLLVLVFEVPLCCSFIKFIEPLSKFSEGRPHWQKVILYMIPPIIVICLCTEVASIFGALCIVGVAALYFMLTVGKKAPLDQMRSRASGDPYKTTNDTLPK